MKTTKQLIEDVTTLMGEEDDTIKASCFAMYWAIDAIQVENADNEGEPCSKAKAIRVLRGEIERVTSVEMGQSTVDSRYRVAQWLRQQNRVFIHKVSFARHYKAMAQGASYKELKLNPDHFKSRSSSGSAGKDIRDGNVIHIPPHVKAAITIIQRTMERTSYEAGMHDEEGEFDKSAHFHSAAKNFGLALPPLRQGMQDLMAGIN